MEQLVNLWKVTYLELVVLGEVAVADFERSLEDPLGLQQEHDADGLREEVLKSGANRIVHFALRQENDFEQNNSDQFERRVSKIYVKIHIYFGKAYTKPWVLNEIFKVKIIK